MLHTNSIWYSKAQNGDKNAQYELAIELFKQHRSYSIAMPYFHKAALQGHSKAKYEYAKCCLETLKYAPAAEYFYFAGCNDITEAKQIFQKGSLYTYATRVLQDYTVTNVQETVKVLLFFSKAYQEADWEIRNDNLALRFLTKAIALNPSDIEVANMLADVYSLPLLGQQQDFAKAFDVLLRAVRSKYYDRIDAKTCYRLGELYETGKGTNKSVDNAITWYTKASDQGCTKASYKLGTIYYSKYYYSRYEKADSSSYHEANRFMNKAKDYLFRCGEYSEAYNYLGLLFGSAGDNDQREHYYLAAAKMGLPIAARNLGFIYQRGYCGDHKQQTAVNWFRQAAEQGNAESQYILATEYLLKGEYIAKDLLQAFKWCTKAANAGYHDAINFLQENSVFEHLNELSALVDDQDDKLTSYNDIEQILAYEFTDPIHLKNALDRRKASPEIEPPFQSYEFVGDSVLNVVCATALTKAKPDKWSVGQLHLAKESLIRNDTLLPKIARRLKLSELIQLDASESKHQITEKMLADAAEAVIGAVCIDKDIQTAANVTENLLTSDIEAVLKTIPVRREPVTSKLPTQADSKQLLPKAESPNNSVNTSNNTNKLHGGSASSSTERLFAACDINISINAFSAAAKAAPHAINLRFGKKLETPLMRLTRVYTPVKKAKRLNEFEKKAIILIECGASWDNESVKKLNMAHPSIAKKLGLSSLVPKLPMVVPNRSIRNFAP